MPFLAWVAKGKPSGVFQALRRRLGNLEALARATASRRVAPREEGREAERQQAVMAVLRKDIGQWCDSGHHQANNDDRRRPLRQ